MDQLIKQMRVKFSEAGQEKPEGTSNVRDKRIPPQKTQSFKGEKKSQGWFQRQFSRQTNSDGPSGEDELATAIAASAFAINELEETYKPRTSTGPDKSVPKSNSRKEKSASIQLETGRASERFSGEDNFVPSPERKITITGPAPKVQKRPTFADKLGESTEDSKEGTAQPKLASPSFKRISSSADKQSKKFPSLKPESSSPKLEPPPTIKPATPPPLLRPLPPPPPPPLPEPEMRQSSGVIQGESAADAWERRELGIVGKKYDKVNATIVSWETEKKKKARRKLDNTEKELERRRAKALQTFRAEMQRIEQIAGGARAQAEERQKNEELKTREKANKIRQTGRLPTTCFCF